MEDVHKLLSSLARSSLASVARCQNSFSRMQLIVDRLLLSVNDSVVDSKITRNFSTENYFSTPVDRRKIKFLGKTEGA